MLMPTNHHTVSNISDTRQEGGTNSQSHSEGQDTAGEQEPHINFLAQMGSSKQAVQQSSFKFSPKRMHGSSPKGVHGVSLFDRMESSFRPSHSSARPSQAKLFKSTL